MSDELAPEADTSLSAEEEEQLAQMRRDPWNETPAHYRPAVPRQTSPAPGVTRPPVTWLDVRNNLSGAYREQRIRRERGESR